jgi:bacterioferritin
MNSKQTLIDMLNEAFELENNAFKGYVYASTTLTGPLQDVYKKVYREFALQELEHIYEIGEKITSLGGSTSTKYIPIDSIESALPKGYDAVLSAQKEAEQETIEMYTKIHEYAEKIGELTLVLLIEHIMEEEQEHYDGLERMLMDVPKNDEKHDKLKVDAKKNHSERFEKLAQLLFTSDVSEEDYNTAKKVLGQLSAAESDLQDWIDTIQSNLDLLSRFQGPEKSLVLKNIRKLKRHKKKNMTLQ